MVFIQAIFFSFTALFPIVNPMGAAIIFFSLVKGAFPQQINVPATKISIYAVIMLLIILLVGSWSLSKFFCYRYSHYYFDKFKDRGRNVARSLAAFINRCNGLQMTWRGFAMLIPQKGVIL
ncbi:Multiple antibiotic resistance (MarC)-related protein [Legionella nautarum]|uniref:UPF0056 membrane protein n=1 Tax=Legionella nautarum TaxID=45070 RepID=A0A0W0WTS7_9GAMM|nr:MarC family protein [Legionella nautarum]KTD35738.1 Multiple antibiotic resistance (MarC)-related protein [Legionella nautarum]